MILSTLDLKTIIDLTDEQFHQLCEANPGGCIRVNLYTILTVR